MLSLLHACTFPLNKAYLVDNVCIDLFKLSLWLPNWNIFPLIYFFALVEYCLGTCNRLSLLILLCRYCCMFGNQLFCFISSLEAWNCRSGITRHLVEICTHVLEEYYVLVDSILCCVVFLRSCLNIFKMHQNIAEIPFYGCIQTIVHQTGFGHLKIPIQIH